MARIGSELHEARAERDEALKALHAAEITAARHENEVHLISDAFFCGLNVLFLVIAIARDDERDGEHPLADEIHPPMYV